MKLYKTISSAILSAAIVAAGASLHSCDDPINEGFRVPIPPFMQVENESLNFGEAGAEAFAFQVRCNEAYEVKTSDGLANWCTFTKNEEGDLLLNVKENTGKNVRRGEFYIVATSQTDTVNIAQLGWGKAILLSKNTVNIEEAGAMFDIDITANVECSFNFGENTWVSLQEEQVVTRAHETATKTYRFKAEANNADTRIAEVQIKDADETSDITPVLLTVIQKKLGDYSGNAPAVGEDIQLFALEATGDGGFRPTRGYDLIIDGETNTGSNQGGWLSDYTKGGKLPQYIEMTFYENVDMDYVVVHPSDTEFFKDVEILVRSSENDTWTNVCNVTIPQVPSATRVKFPTTQMNVKQIKFNLTSSASSNFNGVFKCNEIQFFKKNPENFDPYTLFEDKLCTKLKPGITQDDILTCENQFYKNLAWYIFNGKYNTEFRVASYNACPRPETEQKAYQYDSPKSLLDNPTGIAVSKDENLVVMADLKGKSSMTLRVVNWNLPQGDGFNQYKEYTLADGLNNLVMQDAGLVYVMYNSDSYETDPEIMLHFVSGEVNGYYDSQNPALTDRWEELLQTASHKYFDVLGKYVHLTFETVDFSNYVKSGKQLADTYDQLVYTEMEFLGLVKYNKIPKNRFFFNVMYDNWMYSTSYRTSYVKTTVPDILSHDKFWTDCWGPAHEVGHGLQMSRFKWIGMTEVSNNMQSMNAMTKMLQKASRLQTKKNYLKAFNNIIATYKPHCTNSDPFEKLIPFWQLELYFGNVLKQSPYYTKDGSGFYPSLYEKFRTDGITPKNDGEYQLQFLLDCCEVSKTDLTDFFEKWGLLIPCDELISDYAKRQLTVTQDQVNKVKATIAQSGYSKPALALEYISDNTWELYKNPQSVIASTATRSGETITLNGWKNAVAFEVVNAEGKLVYIAEGDTSEFTLPQGWQEGYVLQSVSANGTRTKVAL